MDFGKLSLDSIDRLGDIRKKDESKEDIRTESEVIEDELAQIQEIQEQIKLGKSKSPMLTQSQIEEKQKRIVRILIRIVILLICLLAFGVAFFIVKRNKQIMDLRRIKIEQPSTVTNNANFIYLDAPIELDGNIVKIKRIRLDSEELSIFLDNNIEKDKFKIVVVDENYKKYFETTNYDKKYELGRDFELTFEPLNKEIEKFYMRVENIENGFYSEIIFELGEPLKYIPAKYFYNVEEARSEIYVSSTAFSSSGTKTIVVTNGDERQVGNINKENVKSGNLYIKHKGVTVPIEYDETEHVYFEEYEKAVSIIKNIPLDNLMGSITYGANNFYRTYYVDEELDIHSLSQGYKHIVEIENNAITLEGIMNYNGIIAIPMYGKKTNAIPGNPIIQYSKGVNGQYTPVIVDEKGRDKYFDRTTVSMDATLYAKDENGNEFTVEADSRVGDTGTDVLFIDDRLKDKTLGEVRIVINNYSTIEQGDFRAIELAYAQNSKRTTELEYSEFLRDSFLRRLKYKSRELTEEYVTGFDENMITNFKFDDYYKQVDDVMASYSAYVEGVVHSDGMYYAIVKEQWDGKAEDGSILEMKNTHKVVAEKYGRDFLIVYDKIVE